MPIKPRPVYEPHTIPDLWESYQATLNLGVGGKPYINEHDFILIHDKTVLADADHECQGNDIFNYGGCLFPVIRVEKQDDDLYYYIVNDGDKEIVAVDSDIKMVYKRIPN